MIGDNCINKIKLKKHDIAIVALPMPLHNKAGEVILTKFIKIFEPLSDELFVITGNFPKNIKHDEKIHIKSIKYDTRKNSILMKIVKYMIMEAKLSCYFLKIPKKDVAFLIGSGLTIPLLSAKLARTKTVVIAIGLQSKSSERLFGGFVFSRVFRVLEKVNFALSDMIIVESASVIDFLGLNKYRQKLAVSGVYIDTNFFQITKELNERKNLVGYVGRLSLEKGVMNFVKAMPLILEKSNNIEFLMGGGGTLQSKIGDELRKNNLSQTVKQTGGILHNEIVDYFNELKLFILPSYSEGLPHTVLEAMACGTPVLATPVGGIPDVIKDGETGFIMKDNSPECIAENVMRALEHPNLDEIVKNARKIIEKECIYEVVVENYRKLLVKKK
jgi:glycosyltransferase involved in cell wall biosynthesis